MNLTINIPEELYQSAKQIAAAENVSVEELFASAFEERILEFKRLKEKAVRGSHDKFRQVMATIPAVEPARMRSVVTFRVSQSSNNLVICSSLRRNTSCPFHLRAQPRRLTADPDKA